MFRCIERVLKKRSKADRSPDIFQPNHTLYGALMVAAVVITVIAALIPGDSPLSSIMLSIGSGGIASVAVAWMIDIATCKQNNKNAEITRKIVFSQLCSVIESGIQVFAMLCFQSDFQRGIVADFDCKRTWLDWVASAFSASKNDPEDLKQFCFQSCILADSIKEQTSIINAQTVSLLDSGIIGKDEKQTFSAVMNVCDLFRYESNMFGISPKFAERCLSNFKLLHGMFHEIPAVREVNDAQIGITLFQNFNKETLNKIYHPEKEETV